MSSSSSASPCYKMQALSWHAEDVMDDEDDTMKYTIKIFGLDTMNRSMSVTVKGFPPHFFLKMNDEWTSNDMRVFANYTCDTVLKGLDPVPYDRRGKDFWGFTNNKEFKFLRLSFPSLTNMRRAVAILGKHKKVIRSLSNIGGGGGPYQYQLYESNIEPYLRFIHLRGLEPCGWIDFSGAVTETDVLESTCKRDIEVHFSKVVPATEIESGVVAKFLVASFDIECTSMGGEFPIPQKDYRLLASQLYDLIVSMKKTGASDYDIKVTCKSAILYALFGSSSSSSSSAAASSSSEAAGYNEKTSTIKVSRVDPKEAKKPSIISEYLETMVIDDLVMILQGGSSGSAAAGTSAAASVKGSRERIVTSATLFLNKASNTLLPKLQGDPIIQIGTTFHRYGDTEICKRVIITLGTCAHIEGPNREEIEVIETKTEAEMLIKWRDMVVREDPDIVTGYNIFGFDFDYMMKRATELGVNRAFLQLSRFKGHVCKFTEQKLSSSALGDNVLKFVDMKGRVIVDLMKVIQRDHKLDSYKLDLVAQHFTGNAKMDVSPQEIFALQKGSAEDRGKIASYCIQDCALCNQLVMKLEIVANNMGMSNVCLVPMEYIFLRGQGIKIFSLLLNECQKEKFLIPCVKREISIRAEDIESLEPVSLLQENRSKVVKAIDASAADLLKMAKTNDAIDVLKPSAVTAAIISLASRKHHVDVGLEHLQKKFIYLQRNDFESACRILTAAAIAATASSAAAAKERKEKGVTDDDDDDEKGKSGGNPEDDSYEGAIVLDPKQGIYIDDPISVLDYASLYPNSMISENLSHDCLVLDSAYDNLPGVEYLDITYDLFDDKKNRVGEHTCRFAQSQMGIIPKILKKLLAARKATRKKMTYMTGSSLKGKGGGEKEVTGIWSAKTGTITTPEGLTVEVLKETVKPTYNSFQVAVLDGLQSAYKVTANSLYGQIGARTSQIYLKEIAACTTATGRKMILKAKEFLESKPGVEVIYGDTDSIFVRFPAEGKKGHAKIMPSIEQATEASAEFRKLIKAPHDLEYEKTFWPFILLSKKRYVGNLYEHDDQKFKQKSMGIVLKRRDNAQIVKKIYGGVLDIILTRQDVPASVEFLKESLLALVKGKTSIDDLVISKSLKADYKDPTRIAHKVLADRIAERDPGSKFQSSDRVPYVYVVTPAPAKGQKVLQGEKIETPAYIKEQSLVPDYGFYITNQIMKPLLQLYSLVIEELPGYDKPPGYFDLVKRKLEADIKGVDAEEKVKDKLEVIKEVLVKQLLFDPMLTMLEQKIKKSLISRKYA